MPTADEKAPLPTEEDAKRIGEFALALAEFLYVLPDKVTKDWKNKRTIKPAHNNANATFLISCQKESI